MKTKKTLSARFLVFVFAALMVFAVGCSKDDTSGSQDSSGADSPSVTDDRLQQAWEKNNDVVGWLTVDGCEIDNVVFQGEDNDEYLRVNDEGESDVWGCYFLDYINVTDGKDLSDKVNIIYGHSLDDLTESEKFSKLKRYKDAEFARQHPTITFDLLEGETQWQIFSACDIPITINYIDPNPSDEAHRATLDFLTQNSYVDFGVDVSVEDQLLILSTCTSDESVRFVIAAKRADK